jgi:hypothetical protein
MPGQIMLRVFGTRGDCVKGHLYTGGPKEERGTARVIGAPEVLVSGDVCCLS